MQTRTFNSTLRTVVVALCFFGFSTLPASDQQRIHLRADFKPGQSIRYQIESQMSVAGTTKTPIANPEGATQIKQSVSIVLRLEVLKLDPGPNGAPPTIRLRATYEKSSAASESDAYDPNSASLADQYNRLEGRSMEFTVQPDGSIVDIKGLEDMLTNPSAAQTVRSWMAGLSSSSGFPREGIEIGQKWSREQPLSNVPLDNLFWRTTATYVRNESCPASPPPGVAAPAAEAAGPPPQSPTDNSPVCAVILTQFTIARHGSHNPHADATPEDYRRNGLRTSGVWTGSGESLDSFSLTTGQMVRSTQSSRQDVDFTVASTNTGSKMSYKGK